MRPVKILALIILFYLKLSGVAFAQDFSSNSNDDFINKLLWKIGEVEHDNDEILRRYFLGLEGLDSNVSDSIKFKFHSSFTEIMSHKLMFHEPVCAIPNGPGFIPRKITRFEFAPKRLRYSLYGLRAYSAGL